MIQIVIPTMAHRSPIMTDDFHSLKDDMTAFIEGHGMRRFHAYVTEDVQSVMWDSADNPDSWKDFVELAKASGTAFLTIDDVVLKREDVDFLVERLTQGNHPGDDIDEARWLRSYTGKTGFVQLGFPFQGTLFLYEISTSWYESYQRLMEEADALAGMVINEDDASPDDEI